LFKSKHLNILGDIDVTMEKDVVVVEIPKVLADEVNRVRVLLGYTSLSEFIRDAIRRRLEDVQHAISQSEEE